MQATPVTRDEPKGRDRATDRRKHATPIRRILDRESGKVVGWLYEWNTGALVPMWKSEPFENIVYA